MMNDIYEAVKGFNTKQWWIYDNENDIYIDPPKDVLALINKVNAGKETLTSEDIDAEEDALMQIVEQNPDWLHDENGFYDGEI